MLEDVIKAQKESDSRPKNGIFYGRFQPFHKGHLKAVELCLERCDCLYIGIRTFEVITDFGADSLKKRPSENPFTFGERMSMIKESLVDSGTDLRRINIIPFPLENPERWYEYIPKDTAHFRIGVSDWDESKIREFEMAGLKIITLPIHEKQITAEDIRARMIMNQNWRELLPSGTIRVIEQIDGVGRIKMLSMQNTWNPI